MAKSILITMRTELIDTYQENRDCLDQQWYEFLNVVGLHPILLPNHFGVASNIISFVKYDGVLLTGGGEFDPDGKDVRSSIESSLLNHCAEQTIPILGICRGMQAIQQYCGVAISPVTGHVQKSQEITTSTGTRFVNSYHNLGTTETCDELTVWARSADQVVKAVSHTYFPFKGIMWHPERLESFATQDINLFREHFSV